MEMAEPTSGSTKEKKQPTVIRIKHKDMDGIKDAALGDEVEFHGKGHIKSQRAADEYGDGEAELHLHSLEHKGTKKKGRDSSKNAAKMPIDQLKEVIKSAEPKE